MSEPLELDLQRVVSCLMWVLAAEPQSSAKVLCKNQRALTTELPPQPPLLVSMELFLGVLLLSDHTDPLCQHSRGAKALARESPLLFSISFDPVLWLTWRKSTSVTNRLSRGCALKPRSYLTSTHPGLKPLLLFISWEFMWFSFCRSALCVSSLCPPTPPPSPVVLQPQEGP